MSVMFQPLNYARLFVSVALVLGVTRTSHAQTPPAVKPPAPSSMGSGVGLDVFGGVGVSWPAAKDSFEALDLSTNPIDFGGGVRVTGLWGEMFLQFSGNHWSETGERVFIDSDGTRFPLGIPLDVQATFFDGTVGLKRAYGNVRRPYWIYVGGGAGVVRYSESSPFAEAGDDLDVSKPSYHFAAGVEIPIVRPIAVVVDTKYRYIPDLLGDGGASAVLGDETFGGFNASVGLRLGFGGPSPAARPPVKPAQPAPTPSTAAPVDEPTGRTTGVMNEAASIYLVPDSSRTPLRTLAVGTTVTVLEQKGEWMRVEFTDERFGRRVGWVQRRFVRLSK